MLELIYYITPVIAAILVRKTIRSSLTINYKKYFAKNTYTKNKVDRSTFREYEKILNSKTTYFNELNSDGKEKFITRINVFINNKKFVGKEGIVINDEIKVLISSAAIQLTYGMDHYQFENLHTIVVFPNIFYNKLLKKKLIGGMATNGFMYLSWKHVIHGFSNPNDNYNVAIHEFTHALKIGAQKTGKFDEKFKYYLDDWLEIGSEIFKKIKGGEVKFIRKYGGVNLHEFFSVCVESFFENPKTFKKFAPDMYYHLCFLLHQNPLNKSRNYLLEKSFVNEINADNRNLPIPEKISLHNKNSDWPAISKWAFFTGAFSVIIVIIFIISVFIPNPLLKFVYFYLIGFTSSIITLYKPLIKGHKLPIVFFLIYSFFIHNLLVSSIALIMGYIFISLASIIL